MPPYTAQSLPKTHRLRRRKEFIRVQNRGMSAHSGFFTILYQRNTHDHARLGITVTKKTGGAVVRNRQKRWIREFFRLNRNFFMDGHDTVIIPGRKSVLLDHAAFNRELKTITMRAMKKGPGR